MSLSRRVGSVALGAGIVAAGLAVPTTAQAASSCSGASGYWTCYATTSSPVYSTTVKSYYVIANKTKSKQTAHCSITKGSSYTSSSSQSVTASAKVSLFDVAELTVSGTQTYTKTLSDTQAVALGFDNITLNPGQTVRCELLAGYYRVNTKIEHWNNYKVTSTVTGSTTVPFDWGIGLE